MFAKKPATELSATNSKSESILGDKQDNYKFLKLVQEQEYETAYELGILILKRDPGASSIRKFCAFIEQNQPQLKKMVQQEREQAQYTSDQSEQEQQQSDDDNQQQQSENDEQDSQDKDSSSSESQQENQPQQDNSQTQSKQIKQDKPKKGKCQTHQWPHICKNPNCPNKAKN